MDIRMLWFDGDKKTTIQDKILRAADYYKNKYREKPNICTININTPTELTEIDGIRILKSNSTIPSHFWIGVLGKEKL
jgi:hypothetical protein